MEQKSPVNCKHFVKDADGFWKAVHITDIHSSSGVIRISPGTNFKKGRTLAGVDVFSLLEHFCPR